jgi:hypothetical protein
MKLQIKSRKRNHAQTQQTNDKRIRLSVQQGQGQHGEPQQELCGCSVAIRLLTGVWPDGACGVAAWFCFCFQGHAVVSACFCFGSLLWFGCGFAIGSARFCLVLVLVLVLVWFRFGGFECLVEFCEW